MLNEPWLQETTQSSKPQGFYRFERQKEKLNPFPGAKKIGLEKLKLGAYYREQGTQNSKGGNKLLFHKHTKHAGNVLLR